MSRINLCETVKKVDFPDKVWEWLDLFGDIVVTTQREAMYQEKLFIADTQYKKLLLCTINKDLSTLSTLYVLLRYEKIHQAASHVRLLCESLITLKYISLDTETRANLFWDYSDIESYEMSLSLLKWEEDKANPLHVERLKSVLKTITEKYEAVKETYTFTDRKGRKRPFTNWCNKNVADQARDCGAEFQRLYELVYKQLSSYVHGSSWSLRRQIAYSRDHYDADIVLTDTATIIRTALVVWMDWAKFCITILNWRLIDTVKELPKRLDNLDTKHFS